MQDNYTKEEHDDIVAKVDWMTWMNEPGFSPIDHSLYLNFTSADSAEAYDLADRYTALQGGLTGDKTVKKRFDSWYPNKQVLFVDRLTENTAAGKMTYTILKAIDAEIMITDSIQPEVMQRWYPLGIEMHYMPVFEKAHTFISEQGRMKYLNPIY